MPNMKNRLGLWSNDTSTLLGNLHGIQSLGVDSLICCLVKHSPPVAFPYQADILHQVIEDAASIGMDVNTWSYGYPDGISQQVQATSAAIPHGVQNHILDMEIEWEGQSAALADQYAHDLAEMTSHRIALHLSSFCNPSAHPIPYAAFLAHCESLMPQSYLVPPDPPDFASTVLSRTLGECPPLVINSLGGELIATVNCPEMLTAIAHAGPSHFAGANIWLWDGMGGDMGVRGVEGKWASAIAAYKSAFM